MQFTSSSFILGLFALGVVAAPVEENFVVRGAATTNKNKTLIDDATYKNIVHYAAYPSTASQLASGPCKNLPYGSVDVEYFNMNFTDTQAVLFRDDAAKELVLGVPGTADFQDYITDFTFVPVPYLSPGVKGCIGCLVHLGFLGAWNSIADPVTKTIKAQLAQYPDYSVVISGHSLGGAIAQLAYGSLKPMFKETKTGYTYGSPRVGNVFHAKYIDGLSGSSDTAIGSFLRTTHFNDGVPQLPPTILGFVHAKTELWESTMDPSEATTYRCYGSEPADCNDSIGGGFINAAHTSYAGLRYNCTA